MYYYTANGETMASGPVAIPDRAGATIDRNVSMAYVVPAAQGTVSITGAPADFTNNAYMGVQACPAARAFAVGCAGGQEAYEDVAPGSSYLIDVPPATGPSPTTTGPTTASTPLPARPWASSRSRGPRSTST